MRKNTKNGSNKQYQKRNQQSNKQYNQRQTQSNQQQQLQVHQQVSKQQSQGTKFLLMFVVVITFTLAFALLINKQKGDSYLNDMKENNIGVTPEVGKTIVAKDMEAIYPKYYVVYINGDSYSIYVYNYYETISQYNLEYNRLIDSIVDYNAKDKMIRYIHSRGFGTYDEVLNNLSTLVESNDLRIY